ncbi:hypothetical protein PR202_gb18233 [Eleusine coracana subsp. coracana]|uniref:Single-stranded DNA binding protein Ssb-like OB fold domain-containing protein n=1 Tax=Eleusine coracana subsp. coracana TaxID=191504 RepID=A0AAV5F5P9_ELECO|nr:hypothetical protein QOZ80_6BG0457630 [Eleusine coracana subsp. coracana]GJN29963.1 hypothetical protein PR202_gb18233 [Eleusine coracana subsp. coracana]
MSSTTSNRRPYGRGPPTTGYVRRGSVPSKPQGAPVALRKPVFTTIDQLRPQTHGHTLVARVIEARTVLDKPSPHLGRSRLAECLVGDQTGTILFTARNDQVDLVKPDTTVIFRNARIDMFKGTMRLAVDKWGRIEVTDPADFTVNQDNNMSLLEYELVNVVDEE